MITSIEIIGLECEVYFSHNQGIVNMCGGNIAAQRRQESGSCKCIFLPNPWYCDSAIMFNCDENKLSRKGNVSFLYLLQYMENNGNLPACTYSSQMLIITI